MAGPVEVFVQHGGVEGGGVVVLVDAGDIDPIWPGRVVGAISAVVNVGADGGDPMIGWGVGDGDGLGVVAVDLVGVEHHIDTGQQPSGLELFTFDGQGGVVVVGGLVGDPFDDLGGSFAFADLGAVLGPLLVGGPFPCGVAAVQGVKGEGYDVGAVVAGVGGGVAGVEEVAEVVGVPGHGPGVVGSGADHFDESAGDGGGVVLVVH